MDYLWRFKNDQEISPIETGIKDDQFFIYDERDPVSKTTRWVSCDSDYVLNLGHME